MDFFLLVLTSVLMHTFHKASFQNPKFTIFRLYSLFLKKLGSGSESSQRNICVSQTRLWFHSFLKLEVLKAKYPGSLYIPDMEVLALFCFNLLMENRGYQGKCRLSWLLQDWLSFFPLFFPTTYHFFSTGSENLLPWTFMWLFSSSFIEIQSMHSTVEVTGVQHNDLTSMWRNNYHN